MNRPAVPGLPERYLGRTDLKVTPLGYGAMAVESGRHTGEVTEAQAQAILEAVLESGINFVDTSIDYGLSEERIGKYISQHRSRFILATKCGCLLNDPGPRRPHNLRQRLRPLIGNTLLWQITRDLAPRRRRRRSQPSLNHLYTPENIVAGLDQSLARMKSSYIDLLQFHGSPSIAELEEHGALEAALQLKKEGKVRFIGVSSTLPDIEDHIAMGVFDALQIPYSALNREHEEVISRAAASGAGVIVRSGFVRGGLSQNRSRPSRIWHKAHLDDLIGDMSPYEFMLRFVQSHPSVATTIVGTVNPQHLRQNIEAILKGPLPPALYEEAKLRLARAGSLPGVSF